MKDGDSLQSKPGFGAAPWHGREAFPFAPEKRNERTGT